MTSYSLKHNRRLKTTLKLHALTDDEFMELAGQVKAAARNQRARPKRVRANTPDALEATVAEATVGRLLARSTGPPVEGAEPDKWTVSATAQPDPPVTT